MEANKILQADVLDIIFEGRNKDYGAYNLRKTYDRRVLTAFTVMIGTVAFLYAGYVLAGDIHGMEKTATDIEDTHLIVIPDEKIVEPPPPVIPKLQPPQVKVAQYTPPVIVPDELVKETEKPPVVQELEDAKIGVIDQQGIKDDGIIAPPETDANRGIIEAPKRDVDKEDETFRKVEIESQYSGGPGAWMRYLNKTFSYPQDAQENDIQGTIEVQFIVDKEGNVSNVEAISGPTLGGLREEAIRVIKKSGKWEPAIQNGRKVKSYKRQPIIFKLNTE